MYTIICNIQTPRHISKYEITGLNIIVTTEHSKNTNLHQSENLTGSKHM